MPGNSNSIEREMNPLLNDQDQESNTSSNSSSNSSFSNINGKSGMVFTDACNDCSCCIINKFVEENPYAPNNRSVQVVTDQPRSLNLLSSVPKIADVTVNSTVKVENSCNNCSCCIININKKQESQGYAQI